METLNNLRRDITVHPALCVDLDCTVRRSKSGAPFIKSPKDVELMPGIEEAIWNYRNSGFLIIGVSNQGGVAHGLKLPAEIEWILTETIRQFTANPFHIIKQCYHMEDGIIEPFNHRSLLRKPDIGMLALAEVEAFNAGYMIDWNASLLVGDRPEDEQCAECKN